MCSTTYQVEVGVGQLMAQVLVHMLEKKIHVK